MAKPHCLLQVPHASYGHSLVASHGHDDDSKVVVGIRENSWRASSKRGDQVKERQRAHGWGEEEARASREEGTAWARLVHEKDA